MDIHALYTEITSTYAEKILNWAVRKTGCRADGEDLAQEVLLQVFLALRGQQLRSPEHFVWKVAHHVWCNRLRALKSCRTCELPEVLPDGTDFTHDLAEAEALQDSLARMRRGLADLSRTQREMMILHYLDGLSVREVAERLGTTASAVTWHLFDARKQVREELTMYNDTSAVYRPGRLTIGCSGEAPAYPDTQKVSDSLLRQNLCLLCHSGGKTLDELAAATGVPKPFLEYDLDWLTKHEFLCLSGSRYYTSFIILNQQYFANRLEVYSSAQKDFLDVILGGLWAQEDNIRSLGFYGSDFPAERLYWSILMLFTSYCSRNSSLLLRLKSQDLCEIRPDGGKYFIMAADASTPLSQLEPRGWNDFYGICSDFCESGGKYESYYWLGVHCFAAPENRPEIVSAAAGGRALLHQAYCAASKPGFSPESLPPEAQEKLAAAVESGLLGSPENGYRPGFVIMTPGQLARLQNEVFAPLLEKITPQLHRLSERFFKLHRRDFPRAGEGNITHHVYLDLWSFGIYAMRSAVNTGSLALPETPAQGVPLTLVLIEQQV